ncbi:nuclear transport factor 2 family protein [Novosphingobium aquimarinum]|uniref:nuclear transport factor 2 family protein n=1 Tax=Novosphingobium aquimarinum TaxID=2682494 RepID=UPI0012EB71EB|nr:nuclear transport factor 2 family protein [Novosphingobium aquimarinum]
MVWTITKSLVDDMPAESARATIARVIESFRSMDESGFEALLAPDIVAFLPCDEIGLRRSEGRDAVMAQFRKLFAELRANGSDSIAVRQTRLELKSWGDTAMATFELEGELRAGCRTIVLRRDEGEWRIVHLHASTTAEPEPAALPA